MTMKSAVSTLSTTNQWFKIINLTLSMLIICRNDETNINGIASGVVIIL